MTKTRLHQLGYRKGSNCYFKSRRIGSGRKATVQVQLRGDGWFDVTAVEGAVVHTSTLLKGVRQLKQWETFAFCN